MARALHGDDYREAQPHDGPPPTRMPASPDFRFAWHPEAWGVVGGRLLPRLKKVRARPGALGSTHYNPKGAWQAVAKRGWNIIPPTLTQNGRPYIKTYPGRGGTVHLERWVKPYPNSANFSADTEGYAEWVGWLVEERHVPSCPLYVIEKLAEQHRNELAVLIEKSHGNAAMQPRIKNKTDIVEMLDAELEKARAELMPLEGEEYDDGSGDGQALPASGGSARAKAPRRGRKQSRRTQSDE